MLKFIDRMLKFSGEYAGRLKLSFVFSFLESMFSNVPTFMALLLFLKIADNTLNIQDAWMIGGIMLATVILRCIFRRIFVAFESGTGYEICARERIKIGDRLKRLPMSYFTEGNLGNITSTISVDLLFIEENGMSAMDKVINGYITIVFGCLILFFLDWRLAFVSAAVCIVALFLLERVEKVAKEQSKIRQESSSKLTSAVLEYIQGISIIKSLHLSGDKAKSIKDAIEETRDHAIDFEEKFAAPNTRFRQAFSVGIALAVFLAAYFCFGGTLGLPALMTVLIYIFYIYRPVEALASLTAQIHVMEAGLDRYERLKQVEIIDEDGRDKPLDRFDIEFKDVTFSYEQSETLKDISFQVPAKSMTALVGASGSGKTTIANLVVRFWDVQQGEVKIGGVNVKELTCDSLLKNISMVFQKVYLFNDTILNNIKFGKTDATFDEVVEAAKKARCHDFIMTLPDGYETVVEEGGSSLSGGEKQRISIARAILKDAPIILLDEATASVDPDNEKYIQQAINDLVRDKTLIVIAHRLSTVRHADQILVIDEGKIVQRGTHDELIELGGQYANLYKRHVTARSWKITA